MQVLRRDTGAQASASRLALLVLVLAGLLGAALVIWQFQIREFYYDCAEQLKLGDQVRQAGFLVNHGRLAGAGISLPPLSAWFMGVVTWFSRDPTVVTAVTTGLNLGGFALALWYFRAWLPPTFAALAAILLAVNPSAIFYSNLLWEGSLLQPLAILFQVFAANLLARGRPRDFFLLALTATVAALSHLAGIMLLPLAAVLGLMRRKQIGAKTLLASLAVAAVLSAPYAVHLLSPKGFDEMKEYVGRGATSPAVIHARLHLGMASVDFYRLLFHSHQQNLREVMRTAAPRWGPTALTLGWIVAAALFTGWARYLFEVLRARRLFVPPSAQRPETALPVPVQVAGFVLSGIALEYFISGRNMWFKHFTTIYPAYALLAAWPFWRFWGSRVVRAVFVVAVAASLALTVALLHDIERRGTTGAKGAMQNYGISYDRLQAIRNELLGKLPAGSAAEIYATGVWDVQVEMMILRGLQSPTGPRVPFLLTVFDDPLPRRIAWVLRPIGDALARHRAAMDAAAAAVPAGARVAVYSALTDGRRHLAYAGGPHGLADSLSQRFVWRGTAVEYTPEEPVDPTAQYVALDTADPRVPANLSPAEVWRLASSGEFTPIFAQDGIAVLRRGPPGEQPPPVDLLAAFGSFPGIALPGRVGHLRARPDSVTAAVRIGEPPDPPGELVFGPYVDLPAGSYRAVFRVRVGAAAGMGPVGLEVAGGPEHQAFFKAEIVPGDGPAGRWRDVPLDFTVPPAGLKGVEFRAWYPGTGTVEIDTVTLTRTNAGNAKP